MSDWSLPREALNWVRRLPPGANVVELGSGEGTARLVDIVGAGNVYTVEHDEAYLGKVEGAHYIHAPIVGGWYDPAPIRELAPWIYDCLIVDGPPGTIGRSGFAKHLRLFKDEVPLIIDDVHRPAERDLLLTVARLRRQSYSVHCLGDGRAFATLGWGDL